MSETPDAPAGPAAPDEFSFIREFMRPLAAAPEARGLSDDAAVMAAPAGPLVITTDAVVEGLHFLPDDPPDTLGRKALRANLSDLAAKGARPLHYLMACVFRRDWPRAAFEAFAAGLASDQATYGVSLIGGDTVYGSGPTTISITAIGSALSAEPPARSGARAGDDVWLTGAVGDAGLGLQTLLGEVSPPGGEAAALIAAYRLPDPPVAFASVVARRAAASADVSDGVLADSRRIAEASGVRLRLSLSDLPTSEAGAAWAARQPDITQALLALASAGDDYQILFTARGDQRSAVAQDAQALGVRTTRIGAVVAGAPGLEVIGSDGAPVRVQKYGFVHGA